MIQMCVMGELASRCVVVTRGRKEEVIFDNEFEAGKEFRAPPSSERCFWPLYGWRRDERLEKKFERRWGDDRVRLPLCPFSFVADACCCCCCFVIFVIWNRGSYHVKKEIIVKRRKS